MITNAANVGIVQLIGQAIRKRKLTKLHNKIVAIGVCNYGSVKNINDFQRLEQIEKVKRPSATHEENLVNVNQTHSGEQSLEMNHTHYILLDDGTLRYYNVGDYRTRLVKTIANKRAEESVPGIDYSLK